MRLFILLFAILLMRGQEVQSQDFEHFLELNNGYVEHGPCNSPFQKICEWAKAPLAKTAMPGDKVRQKRLRLFLEKLGYYRATLDEVLHYFGPDKYPAVISKDSKKKRKPVFNGDKYEEYIAIKASQYGGIDPDLVKAIIRQESDWDHTAVSNKGAEGLMQLMPEISEKACINPFDPYANIDTGIRYLSKLLKLYEGDIVLALAAYNAGPQKVKQFEGVPDIAETKKYIKSVLLYSSAFKTEEYYNTKRR